MTAIYNYIMRKINEFEDYLLGEKDDIRTAFIKHLRSQGYDEQIIEDFKQISAQSKPPSEPNEIDNKINELKAELMLLK